MLREFDVDKRLDRQLLAGLSKNDLISIIYKFKAAYEQSKEDFDRAMDPSTPRNGWQ